MWSHILGAHQKLNRAAYKHFKKITPISDFPTIRQILHFEGKNGPDGIKTKSPAQDEPWHYYEPFGENNELYLSLVQEHYDHLIIELKRHNTVRAAFEAAWLAHALVDGLTPPHHYPYEEKLIELRGGDGIHTRDTKLKKLTGKGDTKIETVKNNWKMWGTKGLLTTHMLFEGGAMFIMAPMNMKFGMPTTYDLKLLDHIGLMEVFKRYANEIALLKMYERFYQRGWTSKLAHDVRDELVPRMVKIVTLAWYSAAEEAHRKEAIEKESRFQIPG